MSRRRVVLMLTLFVVLGFAMWNLRQRTCDDSVARQGATHNTADHVKKENALEKAAKVAIVLPSDDTAEQDFHYEIVLRPRPKQSLEFPEVLADDFDRLAHLANEGNADASFILAKSLETCYSQPFVTPAELEEAIDQLHQTHRIPFKVRGYTVLQPADPILEQSVRETFSFCEGTTNEQRSEHQSWLRRSADQGRVSSQLTLAQRLPLGSEEARNYLISAWESGDMDAAGWLARMYMHEYNGTSKDLIRAYAYHSIYTELVKADYAVRGVMDDPGAVRWMDADERVLAERDAQLSPFELGEAKRLAIRLLTGNPKCCLLRDH